VKQSPGVPQVRLCVLGALVAAVVVAWAGCGRAGARPAAMPLAEAMAAPAMAEGAPLSRAAASDNGFSTVNTDRTLNTAGHVRAWSSDLLATASGFRSEVYRLSGHVLSERLDYEDPLRAHTPLLPERASRADRGKAIFAISVPVEQMPPLLDWIRAHSIVVEQYVSANRDGSLPTPEVVSARQEQRAQLERQIAALAEQIGRSEGQERAMLEAQQQALQRSLASILSQQAATPQAPVVRYATLHAYFEADQPQVRFHAAWLAPTLRATMLVTDLLGQEEEREVRTGAALGAALASAQPGGLVPTPVVEIAGYPSSATRSAAVIATVGAGKYARSMGDGRNAWFNPFAGFRLGYACTGQSRLALAGELGLELFKSSGAAVSISLRPQALIGESSQVALETGSSLTLAF
jgi:hypothetical protein